MTRLPRLANWLLQRWVPAFEREFVIGDLEEEFAARNGSMSACVWLWSQTVALVAMGGGRRMETFTQDLRYGVRVLFTDKSFSLMAILTLALGIGVSTALFSVIDSALLRPLPYPHPEQLVGLDVEVTRPNRVRRMAPSMADVRDWRAAERVFSHVGVGRLQGFEPPIVEAGEPERLTVGSASEDFLEVFGITPVLGRAFTLDDTKEGSPAVALVAYTYWRDRLGGTSDVIGRVVRIADRPATIVGVLPKGFYDKTVFWQPTQFSPQWMEMRGTGTPVYGRLRPGVTVAEARDALLAITKTANRGTTPASGVVVTSLYDEETEGYRKTLAILSYAVAFIVFIACVNVAGLLLARGTAREAELAVRASVGAGRGRLIRQLLTESVVLAGAAGVLGVFVSWLSLDALVGLIPLHLPPNSAPAINLRVLGSAAAISLVAALVFGLLPAIRMSRVRLGGYLASAGRRHGPALSKRGGQILMAVEVALAIVLVAGAGLMVRSFDRLVNVGVGFDPDSILTMEVEPVDPAPAVRDQFYTGLLQRLEAVPEIAAVGALDSGTLRGGTTYYALKEPALPVNLAARQVRPGYFEALGITAQLGRLPSERDRTGAEPVIVINEDAAKAFFPNTSPLGRTIQTTAKDDPPRRIIGVVPNIRYSGPRFAAKADSFRLAGQGEEIAHEPMAIVMRLRPGSSVSHSRLRQLAQDVGPKVVVGPITSGAEWLGEKVKTPRRRMLLLTLLGGFGLALTLIGIFSMTAYAVARRTREIGVRMAFGAPPGRVVRTMVSDAAWPIVLGLAAGLIGAYFGTTVVQAFLFETTPHDPGTFVVVTFLTLLTACLAAWLPARRAARVNPVDALRAN